MDYIMCEIKKFANHNLQKYKLYDWQFEFMDSKKVLGLCVYSERKIKLNINFAKNHGFDSEVKDVILHEIAHALTPGAGHNRDWKRVCRIIGARPEATTSIERIKIDDHKWEIHYDGKIIAKYWRKPRRDIDNLFLRGKPETRGKLKLIKVA